MDVVTVLTALTGSGGLGFSIWKFVKGRIEANDAKRKLEIEAFERRIEDAEKRAADSVAREIQALKDRILKLEKDHADCEQLLRAEIRRSTRNALSPRRPDDPIPNSLPPPDEEWYEHTDAQLMWDEETQKVIQEEKKKRSSDPKRPTIPRPTPTSGDSRPRAIVVDDHADQARALMRLLADVVPRHWKVETLTDARAGRMVLVMDERVRLAIVDWVMPRFDGEAVITEALRQRPELRGKIIVTSGWPIPDDVARHLFDELGCFWLEKPIEFKKLKDLVWKITQE